MKISPLEAIDFYKADHRRQYPEKTELVYSNFTARSGKLTNLPDDEFRPNGVVFFGLQYVCIDLFINAWNDEFFKQPKDKVVGKYKKRMDNALGVDFDVSHIEELHDLGYLPIKICAVPEGTVVPYGCPMLTVFNTDTRFFWLTNYVESVLSAMLWKPCTSATTAKYYRNLFDLYEEITTGLEGFAPFQGHDFSFRGMGGLEDAAASGMGHLTSFVGTDTVPALSAIEQFYGKGDDPILGCSVAATEHSVMCMGGVEGEIGTFERLITEVYPNGIVSIVSDTWDFWQVVTEFLPRLKDKIMAREGKVVIRPDSGDPVKIICGDPEATPGTPEHKGAVQCLWDIFGGTVSGPGYKMLDEHIGLIYGDSITPARAYQIMDRLEVSGFASTNVVLGIGSYTYQYATRDTHGFAMKATFGVVDGENRSIFKKPKTDGGSKKSHKGLLRVERGENGLVWRDECEKEGFSAWEHHQQSAMEVVFQNGWMKRLENLSQIRARLRSQ